MRYRVYVGPRGSEAISPRQKDQFLFKEFPRSTRPSAGRAILMVVGA